MRCRPWRSDAQASYAVVGRLGCWREKMKTLIAALILITAAWGEQNAPLGQQKMCMEQVNKLVEARQEFRAQMNANPNIITFSYTDTNHFNPRARICYWTTRTQVQTPDRLRLLGI